MPYKTILVHLDDGPLAAGRVRFAIGLAGRFGAHLTGAAPTGVARQLLPGLPGDGHEPTLALHLAYLREQAETAMTLFNQAAAAQGCADCSAVLLDDEAAAGIGLQSRMADLAVLSQAGGGPATRLGAAMPSDVVLTAACPVLVLPAAGADPALGQRVLVAWNGGKGAARALAGALPLLAGASAVTVVVFDSGNKEALAEAVASNPAPWLARHGVTASFLVEGVAGRRHAVGEALLGLAGSVGADLLVMGAYGHSRLRETILGGVTRTVFEEMALPVLMAH